MAPVIVMCLKDRGGGCTECSRGFDSGFVAGIMWLREGFNKSVALDKRGGIWQW